MNHFCLLTLTFRLSCHILLIKNLRNFNLKIFFVLFCIICNSMTLGTLSMRYDDILWNFTNIINLACQYIMMKLLALTFLLLAGILPNRAVVSKRNRLSASLWLSANWIVVVGTSNLVAVLFFGLCESEER